jgi:voltage-gated potassium channel
MKSASPTDGATIEWLLSQRFRALLLALVLTIVAYPVLDELVIVRYSLEVMRTVLFLIALIIIFKDRRHRILALGLGLPTMLGAWLFVNFEEKPAPAIEALFHLVVAGFLAVTVAAVLRAVFRDADVTSDNIYGAFCGYLLISVIFGHFYCMADAFQPDSFAISEHATTQLRSPPREYLMFYFSLITLTTVGYGDVTPATAATRGLAMLEAVVGQFYIAVIVADLIGKRVSQAMIRKSP